MILPVLLLFLQCGNQEINHLPFYNTPDFTPLFLSNQQEVERNITHRIKDFSFTDQQGDRITLSNVKGKVHIANFIFTRCGSICPVMTKNMKMLEERFGRDTSVIILSFSVTPWIDSVERLKTFAKEYDIQAPNWHLLTGNKAEIYDIARRSYFAEEDLGFTKDSTEFLHTEHVLLVDRSLRIRGIYNGTLALEMDQLGKDIKSLLKE